MTAPAGIPWNDRGVRVMRNGVPTEPSEQRWARAVAAVLLFGGARV